jgi:four helix bundle protein
MQAYKDLVVWQKSHEFAIGIYKSLSGFPKEEIYNLVSQLKRASTSIPANIAEGAGRFTQKDFASYLQNALGSTHEVEYLILLSKDLGFLNIELYDIHTKEINEIKAMLISLIKKVRNA